METLAQANTFFFISTIGFVVLAVLLVIALFYFIKVLTNLRYITDRMRNMSDRAHVEGELFFNEVHDMSLRMRNRTFNLFSLAWLIRKLIRKYL